MHQMQSYHGDYEGHEVAVHLGGVLGNSGPQDENLLHLDLSNMNSHAGPKSAPPISMLAGGGGVPGNVGSKTSSFHFASQDK